MDNKIAYDILSVLNSDEYNKAPDLHKLQKKHGKNEYYICLEELCNIGCIVNLPIDVAADGSKMFNTSSARISVAGKQFLQQLT